MNAENRELERKQMSREKVRADIEAERKIEQLSAQLSVIAAENPSESSISKLMPQVYTASGLPYNSKEASRRAETKTADGVAEVVIKGIGPGLLERARARSTEVETSDLPVGKNQEQAERKEQPRQRQKRQVKERDEMEM